MKHTKILAIALFLFASIFASANGENIEFVKINSPSMKKDVPVTVVLPDSYAKNPDKSYRVVYLLHGCGDDYKGWVTRTKPDLQKVATNCDIIFVCPDGAKSWYWDAPKNPESRYETFASKELVEAIDKQYRIVKSPKGRAVSGFSMGGHGSLWLGFRHPDVFGACGSMSGGVDIRPFPENWNMKASLGDYADNREIWDSHTVINIVHKLNPKTMPAIIIDCGTSDFFYEVNEALHRKLLYHRIPHDYITRPGGHSHQYWRNAIDYHLVFFLKFFNSK